MAGDNGGGKSDAQLAHDLAVQAAYMQLKFNGLDGLARHAAELEVEVARLRDRVEELEIAAKSAATEKRSLEVDLEVAYAERDEIDRRMSAMRKALHTVLDAFDEGEEDVILAQPLMPEPHWPDHHAPAPQPPSDAFGQFDRDA